MLDVTVVWMWSDGFLNHTLIGDDASAPIPLDAYDRAFQTADGHMVAFVASDDEWRGFARAAGRNSWRTSGSGTCRPARISHQGP